MTPKTSKQVFALFNAMIAKSPCAIVLTGQIHAQGQTMAGPPWRVTATVKSSKKGAGTAIWQYNTSTPTPLNPLAKKLSAGC